MKNINNIPNTIKEELNTAIIQAIENENKEFGEQECNFFRKRTLTAERMIKILLSMQGGSLQKELYDANVKVTASAFVQQREKLSYTIFEDIMERFNALHNDTKTYKGYRVLAVDGTAINMARNPKSDSFMQNKSVPKGYNQLHVNPIYDVLNKIYVHCMIQPQPKQDEIGALLFMLTWFNYSSKTLLVMDRGYEAYTVIAHFLENSNINFLMRVKQDRSAMREIKKLPMIELDRDISFTITTTQTKEDKENDYIFLQTQKNTNRIYSNKTKAGRWNFPSPYLMKFRVVRFMLNTGEYETLVTNLPHSFTLSEIKELYHARWGIETAFREIKYGIGLVNLHGKKDEFVKQEIYAAMIMSNFCSRITNQIIVPQRKGNAYAYKVNMKMAIYLCKKYYREDDSDAKRLMEDIARYSEPVRPDRRDERNIRAKSFVGFTYRVSA
ncbi:MAG: IS4 family transposase [Ruminococcus flavefaciens]|nr:IS4 family transposase [Ruminococcus flavefaciens]